MSAHRLTGTATALELDGGVRITIPAGLHGRLDDPEPGAELTARSFDSASFDSLLGAAGLTPVRTFALDVERSDAATRAFVAPDAAGEPVVVDVPTDPGMAALLLVEDERGAVSWQLPTAAADTETARAFAAEPRTFRFVVPVAPTDAGARAFPGLGKIGKKLLKVFVYPVVGAIGEHSVTKWEEKNRPYRTHLYGPEVHGADPATYTNLAGNASGWTQLAGGPSLLLVHGTFSSTRAFASLGAPTVRELARRYGHRMFAFEHPTMAHTPEQNARELLAQIPDGVRLTTDIVCHSRGGLVAREIARLGAESGKLRVGRIVFVAATNAGTALASDGNIVGLIDRYSTIARLVPSPAARTVVDALVVVLKAAANVLLERLDGLAAMDPTGDYLKRLTAAPAPPCEYFALAADYEPPAASAFLSFRRAADLTMDVVFAHAPNDLVVPRDGVYVVEGASGFPIPAGRRHVFDDSDGVTHTEFFGQAVTQERLLAWLAAPEEARAVTPRAAAVTAEALAALRPHVVNLTEGTFSSTGRFTTTPADVDAIFSEHLPRWAAANGREGEPLRIAIWAHGGLINEQDGLAIARKHIDWWKANGVYPIYFVWETGLFDAIGSILASARTGARGITDVTDRWVEKTARVLGGPRIWGAMKANAEKCSASRGGATYVAQRLAEFCRAHQGQVELHGVGHSAGSIFHAHFLPRASSAGVPPFATLQLLAPAIRVDAFNKLTSPLVGANRYVRDLTMYTMTDEHELDDTCMTVYRKSLLYLIHRALEPQAGVPILGLQVSANNDPEVRALFGLDGGTGGAGRVIWSVTTTTDGNASSTSATHGGFDDDGPTMSSVAARVLGAAEPRQRYEGTSRGARPWVLSIPSLEAPEPLAARPDERAKRRPGRVGTGERIALCVGIDTYPAMPLSGCVNDAAAWGRLLAGDLGFSDVRFLKNRDATRGRIVAELEQMVRRARAGDTLVFQFAGHGTSLPDDDGDEPDGRDEAFVPYDYEGGNFLIDDDVRELFADLKDGVALTCFIDCCHSGTITRVFGHRAAPRDSTQRARYLHLEPTSRAVQEHLRKRQLTGARGAGGAPMRWVNFSACQPHELAYETNGNGNFTRYATGVLRKLGAAVTNDELQKAIVGAFPEPRQQTPLLDCPAEARELALFAAVSAGRPAAAGRMLAELADAAADRRGGADRRSDQPEAYLPYDRRSGHGRREEDVVEIAEKAREVARWFDEAGL